MNTPAFNDFEVFTFKIDGDFIPGYYQIDIDFWKNKQIENIHKEVVIRNLSNIGGKFGELISSYFILSFIMVVMGLTLLYIHRIKFTDGIYHDRI